MLYEVTNGEFLKIRFIEANEKLKTKHTLVCEAFNFKVQRRKSIF
ncbi:MAG: hypothetical protein ACJA0Q_000735 [Saprospiraceae bacterium]|jgi:hypothetical protein